MTAVPQGVISFAGREAQLSANLTISHGITPATINIYMARMDKNLPEVGDLRITYGKTSIEFPDCRVSRVNADTSQKGEITYAITLLDHRWRWAYPVISGHYNVTIGDLTKKIREGTQKSIKELMGLCADAMWERKFDFSRVPDKLYPEVQWEYTNAAQALQELAEQAGCRIVMESKNKLSVQPTGKGKELPDLSVMEEAIAFEKNERPDALLFVAGRNAHQHDFDLEAVGKELDGRVLPIDELSYKPKGGWEYTDPVAFAAMADTLGGKKARDFAVESVFRWFRIKLPAVLPGRDKPVKTIEQILPLLNTQVLTANFTSSDGIKRKQNLPAWVYGKYYRLTSGENPNIEKVVGDIGKYPEGLVAEGFSIDQERGIVIFNSQIVLYRNGASIIDKGTAYKGFELIPPQLKLRIAVNVKDEDTRAWEHYEVERDLPGANLKTKPYVIRRDDLRLEYYRDPTFPTITKQNKADLEQEAKVWLDAKQKEFELNTPGTRLYFGIKDIQPDGAIQQVTWYIEESGFAFTRVSRNREEAITVPSYEQRRMFEEIAKVVKAAVPGAVEPKKGK